MDNFFRRPTFVGEVLFTKGNLISPAICIPADAEDREDFILAFFLHCSDEQIQKLNELVHPTDKEVRLYFFHSSGKELSLSEAKTFDFTKSCPWHAVSMAPTEDSRRKTLQAVIAIHFDD